MKQNEKLVFDEPTIEISTLHFNSVILTSATQYDPDNIFEENWEDIYK